MNYSHSEKTMLLLGGCWLIFGIVILTSQQNSSQPITIEWETETEFETAGFNIYRSDMVDGEYQQINAQLIPSQADPASGAVYAFQDRDVLPGSTYYYRLEDVEYSNKRTIHPPFEHRIRFIDGYGLLLLAYSGLIIGIGLISYAGYGIYKERSFRLSATKVLE